MFLQRLIQSPGTGRFLQKPADLQTLKGIVAAVSAE
jgi:hypothetical protein